MKLINRRIAPESGPGTRRRLLCARLGSELGGRYSSALGIEPSSMRSDEVFKWFLASLLFGARIREEVVLNTYDQFKQADVLSPEAILDTGWTGLVDILDRGGYVRYDFKTATKLIEVSKTLKERYAGDLNRLHFFAKDARDLEKKLREMGKGIGPVTVGIFLREMRNLWEKAEPPISEFAFFGATMLGLTRATDKTLALEEMKEMWEEAELGNVRYPDFEAALIRLGKDFCGKNKCSACPVQPDCQSSNCRNEGPGN